MIGKNRRITFLCEGKAELFIIERLLKNNKLIRELTPIHEYYYELKCINGNMSFSKWNSISNFNAREKRASEIFIIGDSLKKNNVNFLQNNSDVERFQQLMGPRYQERIWMVSIFPLPEMILIHKHNLFTEWQSEKNNYNGNLCEFLGEKILKKESEFKKKEYWEKIFPDTPEGNKDLIENIKKLKREPNAKGMKSLEDLIR